MNSSAPAPVWQSIAIIVARLIFAGLFIMAATFKFGDIAGTAGYIASAGFPASLVLGFLTGAYFREASLLAAAYVVFLGIAFHGPSHWQGNQYEFGAFVSHFPFAAGLLFAAANGPGRWLAMRRTM